MEPQHHSTNRGAVCRLKYNRAAVVRNYDQVQNILLRLRRHRARQLLMDLATVDIQDALRRAIIKSGKTHYRLGKDAGVAPEVIDRFVSGERDIRLVTAAKLADALRLQLTPKSARQRKS